MDFSSLFAESATCSSPNPLEWIAIVGLITGAGIFSVSTGVAGFAIAATMIDLILAGAGSIEILGSIILSIKGILGC